MLTYGPGRADRWPRTRQPGTRATDRGPGSAARVCVNLGPGSQTRTDQQHKHKHGHRAPARDQAATGTRPRHQAAAARPGRPAATGTRHADHGPGSARQPPGSANLAANNCSSCINLAANNCTRCSKWPANNCKPGSAAHGPGSHRQQLRDANQAAAAHDTCTRFHASGGQGHGPSAGGQLGRGLAGTNQRAHGRPVRYQAKKNPARGRVCVLQKRRR